MCKRRWVGNLWGMKPPLEVRPWSTEARQPLEAGLRASDAFTLQRCPRLLARACGHHPAQIARQLSCAPQRTRLGLDADPGRALLHDWPRAWGNPRRPATGCCAGRPRNPMGAWAVPLRPGGGVGPRRSCTVGQPATPYIWGSRGAPRAR
jgi:hypothetical protein